MTAVRRSKAMPTDGPTAKFLYTIIKQLDLKSIDWSLVASQLEISNGHAARMRYSRFKQQMEGTTSTPRGSRVKKTGNKSDKGSEKGAVYSKGSQKGVDCSPPPVVKQENGLPSYDAYIKPDPYLHRSPEMSDIPPAVPQMTHPHTPPPSGMPYPQMSVVPGDLMQAHLARMSVPTSYGMEHHGLHPWAPVKYESPESHYSESQFTEGHFTEGQLIDSRLTDAHPTEGVVKSEGPEPEPEPQSQ